MLSNRLLYAIGILGFVVLLVYALLQELNRNEAQLLSSISGVIQATPSAGSAIIKTDNAYIMLFKPGSSQPDAVKVMNPFLPPVTFQIGKEDSTSLLEGNYRLLVITDKDGDPEHPAPGESTGQLTRPFPLGSEGIEYILDRSFHGFSKELLVERRTDPSLNIRGIVDVMPELRDRIESEHPMVIMLFDPALGRPVAFRIINWFNLPQEFNIGAADAMGGVELKGPFSLRILTDRNNQPFESSPGELIGRSQKLLPLGTHGIVFLLDRKYTR